MKKISILFLILMILTTACGNASGPSASSQIATESSAAADSVASVAEAAAPEAETAAENAEAAEATEAIEATEATAEDPPAEKNGEIMILYTSDVHCGIDKGFGYVGLWQLRQRLEREGYTTILVDNGDAIQGEAIGLFSEGEAIIRLMNQLHYDVAIPGNHEFDYGMERFMELTEMADFPYVSCNFNRAGELVFAPYAMIEACGLQIAFVGVTTPETITSSKPANFQDASGAYIYGFKQGDNGQELYDAVQTSIDDARAEGADFVYVLGHLGMHKSNEPWTYADVISHTSGIDVFIDGHSHDSEQIVMKDLAGNDVPRSAVGTKLNCIGYSHISAEGEIVDTGIYSWPNEESAPQLLALDNELTAPIEEEMAVVEEKRAEVIARSEIALTIFDPEAIDNAGNPVRMVRRAETNLGNLCADAFREATGADIALVNGGGVRTDIARGEITYGDVIDVLPFGNQICLIEASGQQILDALEWGAHSAPDEFGGFFQVSGLTYVIDTAVDSPCQTDENMFMTGIEGARRVKDVMVDGKPIDPQGSYTVCGTDYVLLAGGDGQSAFADAKVIFAAMRIDNEVLINYLKETLGGTVGEPYADPYGEGRITVTE